MRKRILLVFLVAFAAFVLAACKSKVYKVTFDSQGGSAVQVAEVEEGKKVAKPTDPTKEGFDFEGWFLNDDKFDFDTAIDKDITLKASWKEKEVEVVVEEFTVTFNSDGGSNVPSKKVEEGKTVSKPADPTKEGFEFKEWQLDGVKYDFTNVVTKDITLKAVWTEVEPDTTLEDAKEALVITFAEGDAIDSVTQDVVLPTKVGDVTVSWASSDDFVIDIDGTVERQDEDEEITLTATLKYNGETVTKKFVLTVIKGIDYNDLKTQLIALYAEKFGDVAWSATEDVDLVDEIGESGIVWLSNKVAYFTNDGEVTRPTFTEGDQNIELTATLDDGTTHIFRFKVKAVEQTTEEKIQEKLDFVTIVPVSPSEYQEINFETVETVKIDDVDVDVVWVTSDEDVMSNKGVINPKGLEMFEDKEVSLTATITYDGITLSKTLDFLIKGMINGDSFAELITVENDKEKIFVKNVALYYKQGTNGYYLVTADGSLAYVNGQANMPQAGKKYNVTATVDNYYNSLQLKDVSFNEVEGSLEYEVIYEDLTIGEITDVAKFPEPSSSNVYGHDTYKFRDVKVIIEGTGNYNTFLVDKDFEVGVDVRTKENSVMFYYTVQIDEIRALAGVDIKEIDLVLEGYRTDHNIWYFSYLKPMDEVKLYDLADEEIVAQDKANLTVETQFAQAGTLTLPEEGFFGSIITWGYTNAEDVNNDLIDLDTGAITLPTEGRVIVKIRATIAKGDESDHKDFSITIGEHSLMTIADAIALDNGLEIMISGVVTGLFANTTYGFQDENNSIALYTPEELIIGRTYVVIGTKDLFNGLHQLKNIEIVEMSGGELPEPFAIDAILNDNEALKAHIAGRISIEGATVTKVGTPNSYGNINVEITKDGKTLEIRYDSRVAGGANSTVLEALKVNDVVNYVGNLGWYNVPQLGFGPGSFIGEGWPVDEKELVVEYDFTKLTGKTGTAFPNGDALVAIFESVASDEGRLLAATDIDRIYEGNGTGGAEFENNPGVIKTGTSSATAKMTLHFDTKVEVVILTLRGWTAFDKITINGIEKTAPAATGELIIELDEPSYTLEFFIDKRILMTKMVVDFGSGEEIEIPVEPEIEEKTIAEFLQESEGTFIITGIITSLAPYNSFSMEDETGAVALRIGGKHAANIDFEVGDVVTATVKKNLHNGLIQAEVVGDYEVVIKEVEGIGILDLDEEAPTKAFLLDNQSRIVKAEGAVVVSVEADSYGTVYLVVIIGGESVTVKYDNRVPGFEAAFLLGLKADDLVNIDGATITVSTNEPLLMIDNPNQVSNDDAELILLEAEFNSDMDEFEFEKATLTEDTLLELVTTFKDADVTWTVVEGEDHIDMLTGQVTIPEATATLILEAEFQRDGFITTREYEFVLSVPISGQVYHETFDTSTLGTAYDDATFKGVNDVEWVITHSRDEGLGTENDYAIDEKGIMLRRGSDSSISVTFEEGIVWFSFDARKAFTGTTTRTLIVSINGVEQQVVINSGAGADATVANFEFNVAAEGPVTIVIKPQVSGNHQITIDNFKWIYKEAEEDEGLKFDSIDEMKVAFLTDLHTYSNSSDDLDTFMHGEGKTSGYNGTWITLIQDGTYILYGAGLKEEDSSKPHFINQPEYNEKWLPLLEYVSDITTEREPAINFWTSPYTGVRRINLYFMGTTFNQAQLEGWPEVYQK